MANRIWAYPLWTCLGHRTIYALASKGGRITSTSRHVTGIPERVARDSEYVQHERAYTTSGEKPADATSEAGVLVERIETSPGNTTATMTLSNPRKLNIVNTYLLDELISACNDLSSDLTLRSVVLQGGTPAKGKASSFIGGADISQMHALTSSDEARAFITKIHNACQALRNIPVPVIASIDGFCLGAGLEIAAACDLRVATEKSVFGMPEVRVGIPSVVEAALLPGLIGSGRTRRLLYLAENIDAVTAEKWGLVEKIVTDEVQLNSTVEHWISSMAEMGPLAMRRQKKLMQRWENCSVDEGIQAGVEAFADSFRDGAKEPKDFMQRFLGRRR